VRHDHLAVRELGKKEKKRKVKRKKEGVKTCQRRPFGLNSARRKNKKGNKGAEGGSSDLVQSHQAVIKKREKRKEKKTFVLLLNPAHSW